MTYTRRNNISFGKTTEEGVRIDDTNMPTIIEHLERSKGLLAMSYEINNTLDMFNKNNGVACIVREIKNNELILSMYDNAQSHSLSSSNTTREKLDNKFVSVTTVFEPYLNKSSIRKEQKLMRAKNRKLQGQLDTINAQS